MRHRSFLLLALILLLLIMSDSGSVIQAQTVPVKKKSLPQTDPCSDKVLADIGRTPNPKLDALQYFTKDQLVPKEHVPFSCEFGKVQGWVDSPQYWGWLVGHAMPVTVHLIVDRSVVVDFRPLLNGGIIRFNGSDFMLAQYDPVEIETVVDDEKIHHTIYLSVQVFKTGTNIPFTLQLRYATEYLPGNQIPDWKILETPIYVFTMSTLTDNGDGYIENAPHVIPSPQPWFTGPAIIVATFCAGFWEVFYIVAWVNRLRPRKVVPPNMRAWRAFDETFAHAKKHGWGPLHYQRIASELRIFLTMEAVTTRDMGNKLKDHKQRQAILSVLEKCDQIIYTEGGLTDEDNKKMRQELEMIIKRP